MPSRREFLNSILNGTYTDAELGLNPVEDETLRKEDYGICDECGSVVMLTEQEKHEAFHERIDDIYTMARRGERVAIGMMIPNNGH